MFLGLLFGVPHGLEGQGEASLHGEQLLEHGRHVRPVLGRRLDVLAIPHGLENEEEKTLVEEIITQKGK